MTPPDLAVDAAETFQPQEKGLINYFLIVEGENITTNVL
jgi:hypothetical protein